MNNESILSRIQEHFGSEIISSEVNFGILTIEISAAKSFEIIEWLLKSTVSRD
jgi:hypothetical protein